MEIKLRNISYDKYLNNINHTFKKNKITTIIGPSGSGKTLLSYLLMGFITQDDGDIIINNKIVNKKNIDNIRNNIGYVFQEPQESFIGLTVKEELEYSLRNNQKRFNNKEKIINQALDMLEINKNILDKDINDLSSGEQEIIAIITSFILNPKVLVLDEPTVNLDNKTEKKLIRFLKKISKDYNKTIIIISNNIEFAYKISDEILLLNNGRLTNKINYQTLSRSKMEKPKILEFINYVKKEKNIKLKETNNINELIKDITNNV